MPDDNVEKVRALLLQCSPEERAAIFREMRATHLIHEYERITGARAEMILEAIYRAPELTRRMLRGVIADAAFAEYVVPLLTPRWQDVTEEGNFAYDYKLRDVDGRTVTIQIKLQRSERGAPVVRAGASFGFTSDVYVVETQKTRGGKDAEDKETRPYRYGEFDVLAVSLQPSTGVWDRYVYTLGRWLIAGNSPDEIAVMQPVTRGDSDFWTKSFEQVVEWLFAESKGKRMQRNGTRRVSSRGRRTAPSVQKKR
ncbi:MAG: hypothetical protein U1F52_05605 [Burkholderiales bacterium]